MNNVNKTLFIPLYGKSYVSKKGIILEDGEKIESQAVILTTGTYLKSDILIIQRKLIGQNQSCVEAGGYAAIGDR